jgi:hypothetical protein
LTRKDRTEIWTRRHFSCHPCPVRCGQYFPDSKDGRLRVLHIPKTAGTSLCNALARIYLGPEFLFSGKLDADRERFRSLSGGKRRQIAFIRGHAPLRTGIPEVDGMPTVALLREPVSRMQSFCQHVWEGKSPHLVSTFPAGRFKLADFLNSGNPELQSLQTRLLIGREKWDEGLCPEVAAALAFEQLKKIAAFGLVEHLNYSLLYMKRVFDWPWLPVPKKLNRKCKTHSLHFSTDHIQRIRDLNRADILLYQHASNLFLKRISRVSAPDLHIVLERFRTRLLGLVGKRTI